MPIRNPVKCTRWNAPGEEEIYEVKFKYLQRHLRVTKPTLVSTREDWVTYSWTDMDCFNALTAERIQASIKRADEKNQQRELQRQTDWELSELLYEEHPQLTADDLELIETFSNVNYWKAVCMSGGVHRRVCSKIAWSAKCHRVTWRSVTEWHMT